MYTVTPGFTGMSPHTWDCRRASSHLGLQVWTLMPRITGVYCYTWDYWHAPSYLGLNACPLIPGIAGKHPHTWNSKCVPSHTWDYKGAPSHLGLPVWTLTPDFHGTFFFWGACRRFLFRSWVPTFISQPSALLEKYWTWLFSWPSAFCHLPSLLQGKSHMLSPGPAERLQEVVWE